jgi:threonyl-tRNA synthetase
MALPEKFKLEYMDNDGVQKRPVMLHRALFGSVERFFGILIENFVGRFPLWISPSQVRVITVADRHAPYAHEVARKITAAGFVCDVDDSSESVNKKVRAAQLMQYNYMLTVGDQEQEKGDVSLRTRDNVVHGSISVDSFLDAITKESETRSLASPFAVVGETV